jgi:hypothetical protein
MSDQTAPRFPVAPVRDGASPQPWYRRRAGLVVAAIVAILVVTVLTDLPAPDNRASDIAAAKTVIGQTSSDLAPCANATGEAFQLYGFQTAGTITGYERANVSQWLAQDVVACSFANAQVFDLSNVDVPGTASGKQLGDMLSWATQWATSDALNAMDAIQKLMSDPTDASARATLQSQWQLMVVHRNDADRSLQATATMLATALPSLGLPSIPQPASTTAQS